MKCYSSTPTPPQELADFPGLSQKDLDTVDRLFNNYLFFEIEKKGRTVYTTCCHRQEFIAEQGRLTTPAERLALQARHNEYVTCPYCGRVIYAQNRRLLKKGLKLEEYHAVVFLHVAEDGQTVWAQGYWTTRRLMNDLTGLTLYLPTCIYRFQPGVAQQWEIWDSRNIHERKHPKCTEPCRENGIEPYTPIGLERLEGSFLKYTGYAEPMPNSGYEKELWNKYKKRSDLIRYLTAAARYPRQVEQMRKMGLDIILGDLVWAWKKNAAVLNWKESDPRKAFDLPKAELKEFVALGGNPEVLKIVKTVRKLGGKMTLPQAQKLKAHIGMALIEGVLKKANTHKIPINALLRYLDSFTGPRCHGTGVTLGFVTRYWLDYIDMAVQLGYDLSNPIWQMPRELEQKHDQLAEAVNAVKIAQRRQEAKKRRQEAKKRRQEAEKRYGFALDGLFVRAPMDGEEIAEEGRALKHCVGGYAQRHMDWALTILFLRRAEAPDIPYVTIEMRGNKMQQIHGYRNEREACPLNPEKRPIEEIHKAFLDIWLDWVKKGSKRHEDGSPVLPKKNKTKKEKTAA